MPVDRHDDNDERTARIDAILKELHLTVADMTQLANQAAERSRHNLEQTRRTTSEARQGWLGKKL